MAVDARLLAHSSLEHLSDEDLRVIAANVPEIRAGADAARFVRDHPRARRGAPSTGPRRSTPSFRPPRPMTRSLALPRSSSSALPSRRRPRRSPTREATSPEWLGPKRRTPVFDVEGLREFLSSPWRRLFLAELLGSYTHVHSGSVLVRSRRGIRRQRFSELDPIRLASVLEAVPEIERPGIYRRLGDLALFLTGVFPDHVLGDSTAGAISTVAACSARDDCRTKVGRRRARSPVSATRAAVEPLGAARRRRWYRIAYELVPPPVPATIAVAGELSERFGHARRILNVLTDRYLFPFRSELFGVGASG